MSLVLMNATALPEMLGISVATRRSGDGEPSLAAATTSPRLSFSNGAFGVGGARLDGPGLPKSGSRGLSIMPSLIIVASFAALVAWSSPG